MKLIIIGGGLAGCEAAWQAAKLGVDVMLYEMRPDKTTEAHKTDMLAELVCSNSLRSKEITNGAGLLKKELETAGSLIMQAAAKWEVPAGSAFAVDRDKFAAHISNTIQQHTRITVIRQEISSMPDSIAILATGPLTSMAMAGQLSKIIGAEHLYFYDAIAPIIDAESIDYLRIYKSSRYGKGGDDYINCPMTKGEYDRFYESLIEADIVEAKNFEDLKVFEGCMPVEVMARRGKDTLRFGPLKPVGLPDPSTGQIPYAVVQLRTENREFTAYNMVGFQTRLRWPEQKRIFRMIPGLENAEFLRYGSIHRNTYINAPKHLNADLTLKNKSNVYLAGQITGVEGYIESTAMGLIAGINAVKKILGKEAAIPPENTAHGALIRHLTQTAPDNFQPSNINFGLMQTGEEFLKIRDKKLRRQKIAEKAIESWGKYLNDIYSS